MQYLLTATAMCRKYQNLLNYHVDQLVLIMNWCSKKKFSWKKGIILVGLSMLLFQGFFATVLHWLLKYLFCSLLLLRLVQHTGFHTPLLSEDWCSELFSSRGGLAYIFQNKIPSFGVTLALLIPFILFFCYAILPNLSASSEENVAYCTVPDS